MSAADRLAATLSAALGERLVRRGAEGFAALAEVVYSGEPRLPELIARPVSAAEVSRIVQAATAAEVPIAIRGRGHGFARHGVIQDGLVIDLRLMADCGIDPVRRIGTAGASTTTGAYTAAAGRFELATGFGDHPDVGIPGLVLGGGVGYLSRRDGLTIDNLLDAETVLADGSIVLASREEHPDLFWALRGGGGNFGVVTRLRMALAPTPPITGGLIAFAPDPETVTALFAAAREAADALTLLLNVMKTPPAPVFPAERHGRPIIVAHVCHAGDPGEAERALAPLRAAGTVLVDHLREQPYPELFALATDQQGTRTLRATGFADAFPPERAAAAIEAVASAPTSAAIVNIRPLGGAVARVAAEATAFAHRDRAALVSVRAIDHDAEAVAAGRDWVAQAATAIELHGAAAVNFLGDDLADPAGAAYPPDTLARLRGIKARYDPDNAFRSNHNVAPLPNVSVN